MKNVNYEYNIQWCNFTILKYTSSYKTNSSNDHNIDTLLSVLNVIMFVSQATSLFPLSLSRTISLSPHFE